MDYHRKKNRVKNGSIVHFEQKVQNLVRNDLNKSPFS